MRVRISPGVLLCLCSRTGICGGLRTRAGLRSIVSSILTRGTYAGVAELEYVSASNTELSGLSAMLLDPWSRRYPWFDSLLLYYMPRCEILVNERDSDSRAHMGLRVRLPSWVLRCDATTGNGPVLKTGDPRRRTGGSSPSHSALQTWLNWQKHLPAKEGPGDRHAGSRPAVCVQVSLIRIN